MIEHWMEIVSMLGVVTIAVLVSVVRRMSRSLESLVGMVEESHRVATVEHEKLAGRVALIEEKIHQIEGERGQW